MTYFAGKLALGHVFLEAFRFSLVSIIPSLPHTDLHLLVAPTRRANVRKPVNLQIKQSPSTNREALSRKKNFFVDICTSKTLNLHCMMSHFIACLGSTWKCPGKSQRKIKETTVSIDDEVWCVTCAATS